MSLAHHYQNAYVTHNLDTGMGLMRSAFSLDDFTVMEVPLSLKTPSGQKSLQVRVALAWVGALQIELIQPVSGYVEPYLSALPADPKDSVPRLHHVAVRRDDLSEMRREVESLGLPLAFEIGAPDLTCIFVDARQRVGHHLEFVFATSTGWEMVGWPKGLTVR